jgi:2-amino-4-hydroxy-6-hydroxymethyldihydropteridine diphosphokinase
MEFRQWEPVYGRILEDFGYSRASDEEAARELAGLAAGKDLCDDVCLSRMFGACATVVAGPPLAGPRLTGLLKGTTLSVGIGTALLMKEGTVPDLVVTDLDGDVDTDLDANRRGAVLVVHAHGDNLPALRRYVPSIRGRMVPTTQSAPFGIVRDFGGFTDGDRAIALASHFGVRKIRLIGFDLKHPRPKSGTSPETKAKKLRWAERIIGQMESEIGIAIEYL